MKRENLYFILIYNYLIISEVGLLFTFISHLYFFFGSSVHIICPVFYWGICFTCNIRILTVCLLCRLQIFFPVYHLSFNFIVSFIIQKLTFFNNQIFLQSSLFFEGRGLYFLRPFPLQNYNKYSSVYFSSTFNLLCFTFVFLLHLHLIQCLVSDGALTNFFPKWLTSFSKPIFLSYPSFTHLSQTKFPHIGGLIFEFACFPHLFVYFYIILRLNHCSFIICFSSIKYPKANFSLFFCKISSEVTHPNSSLLVILPISFLPTYFNIKNDTKKNLQAINAGEDVEKREPSCTVGGNVN